MRFLILPLISSLLMTLALPASGLAQQAALEQLAAAARANRRDAAALTAYGRALLRAGRHREAERQLRSAARLQPGDLQALYAVAEVAFARMDYQAARNACRPIERAARESVLARVCRARAFLVWNRAGRAFEELEAAIALEPGNFDALFALGEAHRLRANVAEAEPAYRAAIAIDATRYEPHLGLGRLFAAAEREADARRELREASSLDADNPEIQYELGMLSAGAERLALLGGAAAGRPGWGEAQLALGEARLAARDLEGARAAFEAALAANERLSSAHTGLGRILQEQGDLGGAEEAYRRALELVSNTAGAELALGQLMESTERISEAFGHFERAATIDPSDPSGLLAAARLALRQERMTTAAGYLDQLRRNPRFQNLSEALALYGDVLAAGGDRARARQMYEEALGGTGEVDRARIQAALRLLAQPQAREQRRRATVP